VETPKNLVWIETRGQTFIHTHEKKRTITSYDTVEGKSSVEGNINSQQCKQGNALTLFIPKWFSSATKYENAVIWMQWISIA
jgi:hypothetical protein